MINSNNLTRNDKLFRKLALLTVITIYLLILAGGIVRSTGSGMGCPDWPKCFGQWIPPTDVSQLPANYKEIYVHRGYANTTFNAAKTWIEYVNRLLGVLTGFFIFLTLLVSLRYSKRDRSIPILSLLAFLLVGLQGWLGSVVVKLVLAPWIVTLHMLLAIVIVGLLLYVVVRTHAMLIPNISIPKKWRVNRLLILSTVLLLSQIILGTQVRQMVDQVARLLGNAERENWLTSIGTTFHVHRSFSLVVLCSQLIWYLRLKALDTKNPIKILSNWVLLTVGANIATGVIMAYFAMPPVAQPVHLTLAIVALGIQFVILLLINRAQLISGQPKYTVQSAVQA